MPRRRMMWADREVTVGEVIARLQRLDPKMPAHTMTINNGGFTVLVDTQGHQRVFRNTQGNTEWYFVQVPLGPREV